VLALARELDGADGAVAVAGRSFAWVRDQVRHSIDHQDQIVTCSASDVLRHRTGLCYAKSHLLAALLRANGLPAGFVYQRLSLDDTGTAHCLHGLNAVHLPGIGWYRMDARGDRPGVSTRFAPPIEAFAFPTVLPGESTFAQIWAEPLPVVISALRRIATVSELMSQLPDFNPA
jgi:transglutaminase-like putative cysteine protease